MPSARRSAFTVARRTSRGWRFWFYNADYTLGDQLAYLGASEK